MIFVLTFSSFRFDHAWLKKSKLYVGQWQWFEKVCEVTWIKCRSVRIRQLEILSCSVWFWFFPLWMTVNSEVHSCCVSWHHVISNERLDWAVHVFNQKAFKKLTGKWIKEINKFQTVHCLVCRLLVEGGNYRKYNVPGMQYMSHI